MSTSRTPPANRLWQVTGRSVALPADWRERLVARLGQRPRRLGTWTELALYGALECLADVANGLDSAEAARATALDSGASAGVLSPASPAGPPALLPPDARLRIGGDHGCAAAIGVGLEQFAQGWVLPFTFMQTLPSQTLAALARTLGWQGEGSVVAGTDPLQTVVLACTGASAAGVLWGWVDELPEPRSLWLRLEPLSSLSGADRGAEATVAAGAMPLPAVGTFSPLRTADLADPALALLRWGAAGLEGGFSD